MKLLAENTKTKKSKKLGIKTTGLSLLPNIMGGGKNLCKYASAGCRNACLVVTGMGVFPVVKEARMARTKMYLNHKKYFVEKLKKEISAEEKKAEKAGMKCAIRLNVLSDEAWHEIIDFNEWPNVQFYDYTPNTPRMIKYLKGELPKNYHLTYSRKENNQAQVELILKMGGNVAVVFQNKLPETYLGKKVVFGDDSDARFLDEKNVVVGLIAKGKKAREDSSNFVIRG